jgi:hypothetical protein
MANHPVSNLTVVWSDGSIRLLVEYGVLRFFKYTLLTSLDSATELSFGIVSKTLTNRGLQHKECGLGALFNSCELTKYPNVFNGFDEIWCFDVIPILPKPPNATIVSPFDANTDQIDGGLPEWIKDSGCIVGMGDGIGVNIVSSVPVIASMFRNALSSNN